MSVSVYSEIVYPTHVRRRYVVTLTDNLSGVHNYVLGIFNHQPVNDGSEVEAQQLQSAKDQEIQTWIAEMEKGNDPWHTAPYINVIPKWNTWDDISSATLKHWLLKTNRQELLNCNLSVNSTSNGDVDDLLTLVGSSFGQADLRGEIQQAVNTQTELDTYTPSVVE